MADNLKLKVGDKVVRCGRVLKAFKISRGTVFLKPYFSPNTNDSGLIYSLPLENMVMTKMRRVVSKQKLNGLFKSILTKTVRKRKGTALNIKELMGSNDLAELMKVVKMLWSEKHAKLGLLSGGKLTAYKQAMDQATEEVAAVRGLSIERAKEKIASALRVGS